MTLRLAHLADLHLGLRQFTRQTPVGINQREADVARAFRHAVDGVIAAAPDAVLIAGDVFHSVRPTNPSIVDSFNQLRRVRAALPDVPIVVVAGNHDTPRSTDTVSILRLFEALPDVHVVDGPPRVIRFDRLELAVTGYPRQSFVAPHRPTVAPEPGVRWNVLVMHGEIAGVVPGDRSSATATGATMELSELHAERWSYVALGHYHVACRVAANAWYAGSLEYVSANPWAETEAASPGIPAGEKGWLLVTLGERGPSVEFKPVPLARRHIDLRPVYCEGMGAEEVDRALAEGVRKIDGGIAGQVVRQVLYDLPRSVSRDLDHRAIREYKAQALHYRFDPRRPHVAREVGLGSPVRRQTLRELLDDYLERRPLPPGLERADLVKLGRECLGRVDREGGDAG